MKYTHLRLGCAVVALMMATSCNNRVSVDGTIGHGNGNKINFTKIDNHLPPHDSSLVEISCRYESSGNPVVIGKIGSKDKALMRIKTGSEYFGNLYDLNNRCNMIADKTNRAIAMGAKAWKADLGNEKYPIICGVKGNVENSECIRDEKGNVIEIATFKKGTNVVRLAKQFTLAAQDGAVTSGGVIDNSSVFYLDFKKAIIGE